MHRLDQLFFENNILLYNSWLCILHKNSAIRSGLLKKLSFVYLNES